MKLANFISIIIKSPHYLRMIDISKKKSYLKVNPKDHSKIKKKSKSKILECDFCLENETFYKNVYKN